MLVRITGKHIEITDAIKQYAQEKASKLPKYYDSINDIQVIIDGSEGGHNCVEIIASAEHSEESVAKETGDDTYACIDLALHKLERQLRRKKEKQRNNKHIQGASPDIMSPGPSEDESPEV